MPLLDTIPVVTYSRHATGGTSDQTSDQPPKLVSKRTSKACEPCRIRRIRCQGGIPCRGCTSLNREEHCQVRKKARPNRAPPARLAPFPATSSRRIPTGNRPLEIIENAVSRWLERKGLDFTLSFEDSPRISSHELQPMHIPPTSELIFRFVNSSPHHLDTIDRNRIETLYTWSCALPGSLTDDQLALLHACLCRATGMGHFQSGEDGVRFFRIAYDHLERCVEPSLTSLSALLILVGYAAAHGGKGETLSLLERTADQIRQLGLEKQEVAAAMGHEAQAERSMFSHHYMDTMVSTVAETPPQIYLSDIAFESGRTALADNFSRRVLLFEAEFIETVHKRNGDCVKVEFVLEMENRWATLLKEIKNQLSQPGSVQDVHLAWASVRATWLYIVLRAPLLNHPTLGFSSISILLNSASFILRTYDELSQSGFLNPCWIQIRRIITCIQILILAYDIGITHKSETDVLLTVGIGLVEQHEPCWEPAARLKRGLIRARHEILGLPHTSPDMAAPLSLERQSELPILPLDGDWMSWIDAELDWQSLLGSDVPRDKYESGQGGGPAM